MLRAVIVDTRSDGLHDRLMVETRFDRSRRRFAFGLAATIALGSVGTLSWVWQRQRAELSTKWVEAMTQHFRDDPQHLRPPDPDAPARLARALADLGATQRIPLPTVLRAGICKLNRQAAAHLVFDAGMQRAVVFLVPNIQRTAQFRVADWQGELRKVDGGSVGILARDVRTVREVGDMLSASIQFSTPKA